MAAPVASRLGPDVSSYGPGEFSLRGTSRGVTLYFEDIDVGLTRDCGSLTVSESEIVAFGETDVSVTTTNGEDETVLSLVALGLVERSEPEPPSNGVSGRDGAGGGGNR